MDKCLIQLADDENISVIKSNNIDRIKSLESITGLSFPRLYRQFFNSYEFDTFTINGISFYSNTGIDKVNDIKIAIFRDKVLSKTLIDNGFLQFARPNCGSYDPICFNTHSNRGQDCSIVRICHESILCYNKIKIIRIIAKSFRSWLESIAFETK